MDVLRLVSQRYSLQEDVDAFMKKQDDPESAQPVLQKLEESHSKYKFMEYNLTTKKAR